MMMKRIILSIVVLVLISGCSNVTSFYTLNEQGKLHKVAKIAQTGPGTATYDPATGQMSADTRQVSWWVSHVVPIFSGALDKASRAR